MNQHDTEDMIATAMTFFDHWNAGRVDDALLMLSDDVVYDNVPLPTIIGREAATKFHKEFGVGDAFTVAWQVTNIAANGNVVLNERVDVFKHRDGGVIVLPVMGTLTIIEGAITVWRDYFDLASFERQLASLPRVETPAG